MAEKDVRGFVVRCLLMAVGVSLVGAGIAMAKESGMGTSPISCVPAALVELTARMGMPLTMGNLTFAINFACLVAEVILLKGRFPWLQLLQLAVLFVMTAVIDLVTPVVAALVPAGALGHAACFALSLPIMSLGVFIEVKANVLMLPAEAIVLVASKVFDKPFHRCKITFDVSLTLCGVAISLIALGGLYGAREGTIINALCIGPLIGMWGNALAPAMKRMPSTDYNPLPPVVSE